MSVWAELLAVFACAINPAGVAAAFAGVRGEAGWTRRELAATGAVGAAVALALYLAASSAADNVLDWLNIEPETFRIAAGIVMATSGVVAVWRGAGPQDGALPGWRAGLFPLAIPLLASAAGLMASVSYGADDGAGKVIGAAAPVVLVGAALALASERSWDPVTLPIARLTGAALVAIAAGLIVSGVRDI